jgi:hypothetical protein
MIPPHSSPKHLLCFMFHRLGCETVKQASGRCFSPFPGGGTTMDSKSYAQRATLIGDQLMSDDVEEDCDRRLPPSGNCDLEKKG